MVGREIQIRRRSFNLLAFVSFNVWLEGGGVRVPVEARLDDCSPLDPSGDFVSGGVFVSETIDDGLFNMFVDRHEVVRREFDRARL